MVAKDRVKPVSPNQSEVKFIASEEMLKDLEKLRGLLAHQIPDASLAELFHYALKLALKKMDPAEKKEKSPSTPAVQADTTQTSSRRIPAALKTKIWKRDHGRCTYVDPQSGRKCNSSFRLEIDHRTPSRSVGKHPRRTCDCFVERTIS